MRGGQHFKCRADCKVGRDPAGNDKRGYFASACQRADGAVDDAVDCGLLERGGDVGVLVFAGLVRPHHRALEPGEGEMRLLAAQQGTRQADCFCVALQRQPFQRRTARIAEAQDFRALVECLAQRVVDGGGEAAILADTCDHQQLAVAA